MQLTLTELLGLPGIDVEDYTELESEIILQVEVHSIKSVCPRCLQESSNLHQNHWHFVRDLNLFNRTVILKVNRRQFKCNSCKKPFSEELDFMGSRRRYTDRFAEMVVKQVVHSDTHNVGLQYNLTDDEVWSMVQYISKKKVNIDLSHLKRLGIDEIALRKGHGHYIVVLVDIDCRVLIGLVCSRKHEDIKKVFDSWGLETLKQIEEVSIDMSGSYRGLIEEVLPDASIVADRFHVMKIVGDEFNSAIIQAKRTNEAMPESEEKEIVKQALKGSKYALLKPECNLTEKQKIKLSEVIEACPELAAMHHQKEVFRNIFEMENTWRTGLYEIVKWMNIARVYFEKSVGTIHRWLVEIIGYFDHRTTSGAVEGINNRLKLIKRSGYGFRNFDNFSLRALICWHL